MLNQYYLDDIREKLAQLFLAHGGYLEAWVVQDVEERVQELGQVFGHLYIQKI